MAITANVIPIRLFLNGATEKELVAVVFIGTTVAGRAGVPHSYRKGQALVSVFAGSGIRFRGLALTALFLFCFY